MPDGVIPQAIKIRMLVIYQERAQVTQQKIHLLDAKQVKIPQQETKILFWVRKVARIIIQETLMFLLAIKLVLILKVMLIHL